jgi:L-fuconolactonase
MDVMHQSRLNRRQFLAATSSSVLLAGCGGTPKPKRVEPVGVVDTHTHFYDPTRPKGVPWPPQSDAFLYRTVYPEEFQQLTRRHGVTGTVVVEASSWLEDNQWILDLAEKNDFILGFVGHIEPGRAEFARELKSFTANPIFRGIRIGVWEKSPLANPDVLRDLRLLADLDLSLDILTDSDRLDEVARLAHAIPALRIVVDHCANVRVSPEGPPAPWLAGLRACASQRNIYMKVSGLVEGTGRTQADAPARLDFYRPTMEAVWQAFGESRVIYGSNWPVSARFAPYATVFNLVAEFFNGKGLAAAEKFFAKNAVKAYKISAR